MTVSIKRGLQTLRRTSKTITFDGTAGKGAVGDVPLFTVTGEVLVSLLVPYVSSSLTAAGAATLSLGVTGSVAAFLAAIAYTALTSGKFWLGPTPPTVGYVPGAATAPSLKDMALSDNILGTVAAFAITGGTIRFELYWIPLSSDGMVV